MAIRLACCETSHQPVEKIFENSCRPLAGFNDGAFRTALRFHACSCVNNSWGRHAGQVDPRHSKALIPFSIDHPFTRSPGEHILSLACFLE